MPRDEDPGRHRARAEPRRIAIAGGGTAGHVYPALAVADAYRRASDVDVLFLGGRGGFEERLVPRAGYRLESISAAPFFGVGLTGKLTTGASLLRGTIEARRVLRERRSELVIGFGGYASAGALLAGRTLGIRTAVHEANVLPGRTNRLLARLVDRVFVGFAESVPWFPSERTSMIGVPVRAEIAHLMGAKRAAPPLGGRAARVLVTGGSQGALFLNRHVPDLLAGLRRAGVTVEAWQQVGDSDPEPVRAAYAAAGVTARVERYIEDMAGAYGWADFAVTRAGACTIAELALAGLPALLVPLPTASDDHQTANARALAEKGAAAWVSEAEWRSDVLTDRVAGIFGSPSAYDAASEGIRRLARPAAADTLVRACEEMLERG